MAAPPMPPPVRETSRGTRRALYVLFAIFAAMCVLGVLAMLTHWKGVPFSRIVGAVLLAFGLFKITIAIDALRAPSALAPKSDQRQDTGTPTMFRLWVMYKLVPGTLAILAAIVLFARGSAALDKLVQ